MSNKINIEDHINLIHSRLHKFNFYSGFKCGIYEYDDLVQECMFPLMKAINYYDETKGCFSTIAIRLIDYTILNMTRVIRNQSYKCSITDSLNQIIMSDENNSSIKLIDLLALTDKNVEDIVIDQEYIKNILNQIHTISNEEHFWIFYYYLLGYNSKEIKAILDLPNDVKYIRAIISYMKNKIRINIKSGKIKII